MPAQTKPLKTIATTQQHLPIHTIQDNLIVLKNSSCALVLRVSAVNFGLLSEAEQDATIYAYANFINSLSFPIQILIRSQKKDVSAYLKALADLENKQKNPLLQDKIKSYRAFVEKIVKENEVLDKKFYISIPFANIELGLTQGMAGSLKKTSAPSYPVDYILERAKTALYSKRDHLLRQLQRLGLKAEQLNTQDLIELFYNIYNPDTADTQRFTQTEDYEVPLVGAAVKT
ncbi:hypothetical protein KKD62_00135 [Patescibacteria group bacterium]|nr:hypothetical protein [Patescibacteria group bacterium]MBU1931826.1 hypothetical protein [Patescibacteria group bacterium]